MGQLVKLLNLTYDLPTWYNNNGEENPSFPQQKETFLVVYQSKGKPKELPICKEQYLLFDYLMKGGTLEESIDYLMTKLSKDTYEKTLIQIQGWFQTAIQSEWFYQGEKHVKN